MVRDSHFSDTLLEKLSHTVFLMQRKTVQHAVSRVLHRSLPSKFLAQLA
jgi:hypothetical protein